MLTRDRIEPLAREIAHFLVLCNAPVGSTWRDAGRSPLYQRGEDLMPLQQRRDEDVEFVRAWHKEGRVHMLGITEQAPDPSTIVVHPEIVLSSTPKAGTTITIDNLAGAIDSEPQTVTKAFRDGETEADAVSASLKNESWAIASAEAGVEAGPASAKASAETGTRTTIEAAWNRQTGRTRERVTGGSFPFRAEAGTYVEARIEWNEQTKQRRIECAAKVDCRIEIGRRRRRKGRWGWTGGSPQQWASIDHLVAVAEKRGRVEHALYEHFAKLSMNCEQQESLERIKQLRLQKVDRLSEAYTGNDDIKIAIVKLDTDAE